MDFTGYDIILASKSPRRKELLGNITDSFRVIVREVDESLPDGMHPRDGVELLALKKGSAVAREMPDSVVVSSDTLVELGGVALGKPLSEDDAARMLRMLSGKVHNVHTGVAVHYRGRAYSGVASTAVEFKSLTDEDIAWYIGTGEPMDKAGAYGIQGEGGRFVARYDGDFDTVMGLSVPLTERLIARALGEKND
jgi:septum formation protein